MERYRKIIARTSPILALFKQDGQPEDIKAEVIETLDKHFENKEVLKACAIDFLIPQSVTLQIIENDGRFTAALEKCLTSYRLAKTKEPMDCYKAIALLEPEIARSNSKFWSVLNLEVDKSTLRRDEFLHECLRNMGDIAEDLAKPYLKCLLLQLRIVRLEKNCFADIDSLDFGEIINELIQKSDFKAIAQPAPWNIRLNQWRNIARHGTAKIEKDEIVCWYGIAPKITEVKLTEEELLKIVKTIYVIYLVVKLAYSIFTIDNNEEIRKHVTFSDQREETDFMPFVAAVSSQGFEVLDFKVTNEEARLVVKDHTTIDSKKRSIHASQFLFPLWTLTKSKNLIVEYCDKNGSPASQFTVCSDICERHFNGELSIQDAAKGVKFFPVKKQTGEQP